MTEQHLEEFKDLYSQFTKNNDELGELNRQHIQISNQIFLQLSIKAQIQLQLSLLEDEVGMSVEEMSKLMLEQISTPSPKTES